MPNLICYGINKTIAGNKLSCQGTAVGDTNHYLCERMRTKICWLLLILALCRTDVTAAQYVFAYTPKCESAYNYFLALQTDNGYNALKIAAKENPNNLLTTYIEDYDDFLVLMLNGNEHDLELRKSHQDSRLDVLEQGDESDPYYRLCKAGVYFHWALIYARFQDNLKAATNFRKSFVLLKENRRLFPAFEANNVFFGMEEAIVGTIPDSYKWIASVFGMKGSVKNGVVKIVSFLNANPNPTAFLRAEANIYYCYVKFYLQYQQPVAWNFLNSPQFSTSNNLFNIFIKANFAINFRKADVALDVLRSAVSMSDYNRFPIIEYEMGKVYYLKSDKESINYFQKYIQNAAGKLYVKDAWYKMALMWYLQGNEAKAQYCRKQVLKNGGQQTDGDKQAQRFAEGNTWPNAQLLKAHLLCDGGYYQQALAAIGTATENSFVNVADKLEFDFWLGRIHDELGNDDKALQLYEATIKIGKDRKEHYAARSALQMGFIYEQRGQKTEAIARYRLALEMRDHDYQSSIDQQAKAGLNRLGAE